MRKIFTTIGLFAGLATEAALLPGSALAGQPVTQTLTPPPPAFEICKAIGSGTLCQGSRVLVEPLFDTGFVCGSGALLLNVGRVVQRAADGFTEFQAGPHQFLDLINGDPTVTQKLCTALGA